MGSFPPPGDLPSPEVEPRSPAFQADSLLSKPPGKARMSGRKGKSSGNVVGTAVLFKVLYYKI